MTLSVLLACGLFLLGAASGGLLTHLKWRAVAQHIREEMTGQPGTALYDEKRLMNADRDSQTHTTIDAGAISNLVEEKQTEISQIHIEIDALRIVIGLLEENQGIEPKSYIAARA